MRVSKQIFKVLALTAFLALSISQAKGQWLKVWRPQAGLSLGFGGLHTWGKPSFDLNLWRFTFRAAPGLYNMSIGATYQLYYFKPRQRGDRMLILSAYYHNDWLLANKKSTELRNDRQMYMLMPGIHVNLNYLGTVYFEVSGGLWYTHERILSQDRNLLSARDHFMPMGEVRLGGIFLGRHEYHQDFPHKYKAPKVRKIKKVKLEFK